MLTFSAFSPKQLKNMIELDCGQLRVKGRPQWPNNANLIVVGLEPITALCLFFIDFLAGKHKICLYLQNIIQLFNQNM